jgi:hypothetical protein
MTLPVQPRPSALKKKNAFAQLGDDESSGSDTDVPPESLHSHEEGDAGSPAPLATPADSGSESANEEEGGAVEWVAVPKRRIKARVEKKMKKTEGGGAVAEVPVASARPSSSIEYYPEAAVGSAVAHYDADDDDMEAASGAWSLRKGGRHCHSKAQKQEWSHKAKARLSFAKEKRDSQRAGSCVPECCDGDF